MRTEIYIDMVFFWNFLVDYMILRLAGNFLSIKKKRFRYVLTAAAGALFTCGTYLIPVQKEHLPELLLHALCALFMLRIGLGIQREGLICRGVLLLYLLAFLFEGFFELLAGKNVSSPVLFLVLTVGFYLTLTVMEIWAECFRVQKRNLYPITLVYKGKTCKTCGFYDSGNFLLDPLSRRPVSVIYVEALKPVLSEKTVEKLKYIMVNPGELKNTELFRLKPHLIPFHSVGETEGILLAITLDELCIHTPKEVVRIPDPILALQYVSTALGSDYEVLLNSRLL